MSVLQFGFDGHADNPHSLHNQLENSIVYSGTHDNDTTLGWLNSLEKDTYDWIRSQLPECEDGMVWSVIMSAFNSSAKWAIIPMQDILGLDSKARMNVPGTIENNWLWKFNWSDLDSGVNNKVSKYIENSERKISCEVT
jgi:4-alpha-glucanotransferase